MSGGNFRGGAGIKGVVGYIALSGFRARVGSMGKRKGKNLGEWSGGMFTGIAQEMQKSSSNRQPPVVSCRSGVEVRSLRFAGQPRRLSLHEARRTRRAIAVRTVGGCADAPQWSA